MNTHDIPDLALCPVNIRAGGGIRHIVGQGERGCFLCGEPVIYFSGYWVRWVIHEEP